MSGFDQNWLSLREPVDARARDEGLLEAAIEAAENASNEIILDIGCGTGSTFRALSPGIARNITWRLFDNDQRLLDEAKARHGGEVTLLKGDLNRLEELPLEGVAMVTASALFDLCSADFISRFSSKITQTGAGLYAALNYDGDMRWSKIHPLDEAVTASFNAHQLTDKGFGPSLGPSAWTQLASQLTTCGYTVRVASSPWKMTAQDDDLQRMFIDGLVRAVLDYGDLDHTEIGDWANFRRRMVSVDGSLCHVGHQDVLAIR